MTVRSFVHEGIRHVRISHPGRGTVVVERGPRDDAVEGSWSCTDLDVLDQIGVNADSDTLRIAFPPRARAAGHLRLGVPEGLTYVVEVAAVDVALRVPAGSVRVTSGSGEVSLAVVTDLVVKDGSGDVAVDEVAGRAARVETGSGEVRIGRTRGRLTLKSGSGDVHVGEVHGVEVSASTGSGDIAVPSTAGAVDLRTASGSITVGVADGLPAWLDLHAATGAVRIALEASDPPARGEPYASVRARTGSGEIAVYRA